MTGCVSNGDAVLLGGTCRLKSEQERSQANRQSHKETRGHTYPQTQKVEWPEPKLPHWLMERSGDEGMGP